MKLKKQVCIYSHTHIHTYRYRHKEGICEGTTNFKLTRAKNVYRVYQQIRYLGKVGDTEECLAKSGRRFIVKGASSLLSKE